MHGCQKVDAFTLYINHIVLYMRRLRYMAFCENSGWNMNV